MYMLYKHIILYGQSIPDTVQMPHSNAKHFSLDALFIGNSRCDTRDLQLTGNLIWLSRWRPAKLVVAPPNRSLVAHPVDPYQPSLLPAAKIVHLIFTYKMTTKMCSLFVMTKDFFFVIRYHIIFRLPFLH